MTRNVPYLAEEAIECDAEALLAEFSHARDMLIEPPIPIEDIIEKHLKLTIDFDDTHKMFGVPRSGLGFEPDILGALYFDDKRIVIDQSLDPEETPAKEGRYRFTLAHEGGGHWRLHRHLFAAEEAQQLLFDSTSVPPVICRSSKAKERVEWQADFYASCLLMPRSLLLTAWNEVYPDGKPRIIESKTSTKHSYVEVKRDELWIGDVDCSETDDDVLDRIARPFAERFLVSPIAMRIRLEKLGLLMRQVPNQRILGTD